jgi:hypothetical protein
MTVVENVSPPMVAETETRVAAVTSSPATTNVTSVEPAGTVTLSGTVSGALGSTPSVTMAPPAGAGPLSVIAPVPVAPAAMLGGAKAREDTASGTTVTFADLVTPPHEALIVTRTESVTTSVVMVKSALLAFAGTVIFAGTDAAGLSLVRVISIQAGGAVERHGPESCAAAAGRRRGADGFEVGRAEPQLECLGHAAGGGGHRHGRG